MTVTLTDTPILTLPRLTGRAGAPEFPITALHISSNTERGVGIETLWPLDRILGFEQEEGAEMNFRLDGFSKRGPAVGVDSDYSQREFYGLLRGYLIHDDGEDRLARFDSRHDVPPTTDLRGRLRWAHRQLLLDDWLATFEFSYLSDRDFLEAWEEEEFDTKKEQETVVYLKKQRDNWAFDFITKWRLNDFDQTLTELPSVGLHVAGQDLWEKLTYYQDTRVSHYRERAGDRDVPGLGSSYEPSILPGMIDESDYTFAVSRHVLVLPLHSGPFHFAPTAMGTFVFDDSVIDSEVANIAFQGALGLRAGTQFWHVDRAAKSRLWNIDQIRHVVIPEVSVFWVDADQSELESRNIFNLALRQRWQTRRGPAQRQHSVDFLRLNTSVTVVSDDVDDAPLPNKFFFSIPEGQFGKTTFVNPDFANLGLARREVINQTFSDHANLDAEWFISDVTAFFGSVNYNMHDDLLSQADAAIAVQRSPRVSYFFGTRFLKDGDVTEKRDVFIPVDGTFLTGGVSYQLNRKYTAAVSHQFDLERGTAAYTRAVIIRKFPHWYGALGFGFNPIRDDFSVMLSLWPEGISGLTLGSGRFSRVVP